MGDQMINLIDMIGQTLYKDQALWLKVARIENKLGFGIVSQDGTKMESIWFDIVTNRK